MYTYIIESQGLYKIGKAKNIENRLKNYRTHNPIFKLVKTIEGDYESVLHIKFHKKRSHLEWFRLEKEDVESIESIIESMGLNIDKKARYKIVETQPYTAIIHGAGRRDEMMSLSGGALKMLIYVVFTVKSDGNIVLDPKEYEKDVKAGSINTYKRAVEELVRYGFLTPTVYKYTYWVNPSQLFNGNRINKYPEKVIVKSTL